MLDKRILMSYYCISRYWAKQEGAFRMRRDYFVTTEAILTSKYHSSSISYVSGILLYHNTLLFWQCFLFTVPHKSILQSRWDAHQNINA